MPGTVPYAANKALCCNTCPQIPKGHGKKISLNAFCSLQHDVMSSPHLSALSATS